MRELIVDRRKPLKEWCEMEPFRWELTKAGVADPLVCNAGLGRSVDILPVFLLEPVKQVGKE